MAINLKLNLTPEQYKNLIFLVKRDSTLLIDIGTIIANNAQDSFQQQSFDGSPWPVRYPGQAPPKLNIAGLISDFQRGIAPKSIRFTDRPVGIDSGALMRSLTPAKAVQVSGRTLMVGSNLPYALKFADGGTSSQIISPAIKRKIKSFIKKNPEYRPKLQRLTKPSVNQLKTDSPARPFLVNRVGRLSARTIAEINELIRQKLLAISAS